MHTSVEESQSKVAICPLQIKSHNHSDAHQPPRAIVVISQGVSLLHNFAMLHCKTPIDMLWRSNQNSCQSIRANSVVLLQLCGSGIGYVKMPWNNVKRWKRSTLKVMFVVYCLKWCGGEIITSTYLVFLRSFL